MRPWRYAAAHQHYAVLTRGGSIMRMLWIVTIAVVLFATVSHANRVNAAHPHADTLMATLGNEGTKLPFQLP